MESRIVLGPRIAEGGMAEVFAARLLGSEGFAKDVVVKRVLPQLARDPDFIARFLAEAKLAAQLSHPGIVQVLSLVSDGDDLMMAMELVDGADLSTILKVLRADDRTLSLPLSLRVASSVAAALAYAHEKKDRAGKPLGIIHRDVTPSNILVSREGAVKLIDFGIARASSIARVTRRGAIVGKLHYMAPEQVRDLDVDARVDVWACGVVLFLLLTGRRPFDGPDDTAILTRIHLGERPDVRALADVPEALARVVDGALQVERDARIPSARALAQALDDVIAREGLYASAAELGDLVSALVPPAPVEVTTVRADGLSRTASTGDVSLRDHAPIAGEATGDARVSVTSTDPDEVLHDTTPARKQRAQASLTLDSAETTFVLHADALTRLNTAAGNAPTEQVSAEHIVTPHIDGALVPVEELSTQTLRRLEPRPSRPASERAPLRVLPLAAAVAVAVVAGLGAWGAFAGRDDDAAPAVPTAAALAPPAAAHAVPEQRVVTAPVAAPPAAAPPEAERSRDVDRVRDVERERARDVERERARAKKAAAARAPARERERERERERDDDVEPGTLVIDSRPWSNVKVDGVDVGATPVAPRQVPPGTHTIVFENEGQGLKKTVTVVVKSGRTTTTRVDLRR